MKTKQNKNRILKLAASALILTLVSTCLLGGTLAKYTTSDTGTDSARVAKWGVTVATEGNLFNNKYGTHDSNYSEETGGLYIQYSVTSVGGDTDKVLAPGIDGSFTFSITGTPEVAVEVTLNTTGSVATGWLLEDGITDYEPIKWTLTKFDGTSTDTLVDGGNYKALIDYLNGETEDSEFAQKAYKPNENLSNVYGEYTITWAWAFEDSTIQNKDINDTYLGNLDVAPTINFDLTITVTQID